MKNKLVFRILGAISSAIIVTSVFVPYVKVLNTTQSLWQENAIKGSIYLPIMIIVFGAIGILLFSINKKIELVYSSVGALIFFLVMQTLTVINQNAFKNLNIGYYFLSAGTLITAIMAFICTMKVKVKEEIKPTEEVKEDSLLTQIDRLYNNLPVQNDEFGNNELDSIIQPIQFQNTSNVINDSQPIASIENIDQTLSIDNNISTDVVNENSNNINSIQPISQNEKMVDNSEIQLQNLESQQVDNQPMNQPQLQGNLNTAINPVIAQFTTEQQSSVNEEVSSAQDIQPQMNKAENLNPVVSEFGGIPVIPKKENKSGIESDTLTPLASNTLNNTFQQNKKSDLDIFG